MFAVKTHLCFFHLNSQIISRQYADVILHRPDFKRKCCSLNNGNTGNQRIERTANKPIQAALSGVNGTKISSSVEEFIITASSPDKDNQIKISVKVSGTKTQAIYDEVFYKMVENAQPIPGFRRVKGGKTPNIPKDILLEILGPSKVYEQVIRKIISNAIAQYTAKEGLSVDKDLQIEQSLEDLEAEFQPGGHFRFDALVRFQDLK